jgi:hypothetical protein
LCHVRLRRPGNTSQVPSSRPLGEGGCLRNGGGDLRRPMVRCCCEAGRPGTHRQRSVSDREIDVGCELSLEWWEAISMGCCSTFSLTEDNNNETCQLTGLPLHTTRYLPNTCCGRWVCKNSIALRCGAMLCLAVNKSLALSRISVSSKVAEKRK